jgi:hypothetical protein
VSVLVNQGNGTFAAAVQHRAVMNPTWIAAGDLNGDGEPDLVVGSSSGDGVSVLLNQGGGAFAAKVGYSADSPRAAAVVDLNGDGRPDLALANGREVNSMLNLGRGTFGLPAVHRAGDTPRGIAAADLNGDGKPDIAVANAMDDTVSVLLDCHP